MLVVLGIFTLLMGLGGATYVGMARRKSQEGAVQTVMNVLRQARMSAVDGGRGAVVRINPSQNTISGLATSLVAAWHFETEDPADTTPGARNMDGVLVNFPADKPFVTGKLGLCLQFDPSDDPRYVDCRRESIFDQDRGIRMEAYVRPAAPASGSMVWPVISKSNWDDEGYALWLEVMDVTAPGKFRVWARFGLGGGNKVELAPVPSYYLVGGKWAHVAAEYDGFEARLFVNGMLMDLDSHRDNEANPTEPDVEPNPVEDPNPVPPPGGTDIDFDPGDPLAAARTEKLYIGGDPGKDDYFEGRIDEPRLLSVAGGRPVKLPDRVSLWSTDDVVYLDAQGALDIARHNRDVYVAVGDPYRSGELAQALDSGDETLVLTRSSPFWGTEGYILVGTEGDGYELLRYGSVTEAGDRLEDLESDIQGGNPQPGADESHDAGDKVYFARVVRVTQMGLVRRLD